MYFSFTYICISLYHCVQFLVVFNEQILDFYMCSTLNLHQQLLEQMMLMLRLLVSVSSPHYIKGLTLQILILIWQKRQDLPMFQLFQHKCSSMSEEGGEKMLSVFTRMNINNSRKFNLQSAERNFLLSKHYLTIAQNMDLHMDQFLQSADVGGEIVDLSILVGEKAERNIKRRKGVSGGAIARTSQSSHHHLLIRPESTEVGQIAAHFSNMIKLVVKGKWKSYRKLGAGEKNLNSLSEESGLMQKVSINRVLSMNVPDLAKVALQEARTLIGVELSPEELTLANNHIFVSDPVDNIDDVVEQSLLNDADIGFDGDHLDHEGDGGDGFNSGDGASVDDAGGADSHGAGPDGDRAVDDMKQSGECESDDEYDFHSSKIKRLKLVKPVASRVKRIDFNLTCEDDVVGDNTIRASPPDIDAVGAAEPIHSDSMDGLARQSSTQSTTLLSLLQDLCTDSGEEFDVHPEASSSSTPPVTNTKKTRKRKHGQGVSTADQATSSTTPATLSGEQSANNEADVVTNLLKKKPRQSKVKKLIKFPGVISEHDNIEVGNMVIFKPEMKPKPKKKSQRAEAADEPLARFWIGKVLQIINTDGDAVGALALTFRVQWFKSVTGDEFGKYKKEKWDGNKDLIQDIPAVDMMAGFKSLDSNGQLPSNVRNFIDLHFSSIATVTNSAASQSQ